MRIGVNIKCNGGLRSYFKTSYPQVKLQLYTYVIISLLPLVAIYFYKVLYFFILSLLYLFVNYIDVLKPVYKYFMKKPGRIFLT